ncbi:hypothetical protein ACFPTO_22555 [Paraburkholderia denitrificans]|uniref:DNA-binding protein n=1 Tax=Paraburkholderia denitrificans TaxID=694025 RepID=A0ABW0JEU8_9BURK
MADHQSPQERIAAARQLYAVLKTCLARATWTPLEGALIMSGILASEGCEEMPQGGTGLDGLPLPNAGHSRFHCARRIMRGWDERCCDDEENGVTTPAKMTPHQFIDWFEGEEIDTDWLPLFIDIIVGKPTPGQVDFIPLQIVEHAAQSMAIVDSMREVLAGATPVAVPTPASEVPASLRKSAARVPMPIPENRDLLSTDEFAAVMAVDPQSIRKRYSSEGSYHGVRPVKLANRRVLWPVDAVRQLRNGSIVGKE